LLTHAERLLHLADLAEREMRGDHVTGALRLGSLESAAGARLPPILSSFHHSYPDVAIELQTGTTGELLRKLANYEVEAAFVSEPFEALGCSFFPAFDEELVLITAQGTSSPLDPASLDGRTIVAFPHGCSYRRRLIEWLAMNGTSADRILDLGSYHAIVACVAAGTGVAIVPSEILDHAAMGKSVQRHSLPEALRLNRTHLVWSGKASPALRLLFPYLSADSRSWEASQGS